MIHRTAHALRQRRLTANAALVAVLLLSCALILFPPARYRFYPACPIHEYLGLLCPGCGATRALAALLHGDLAEAIHLNALFVLLLPFALWIALRAYLRAIRPGEFRWPHVPNPLLATMLLSATAFTIARNLPR